MVTKRAAFLLCGLPIFILAILFVNSSSRRIPVKIASAPTASAKTQSRAADPATASVCACQTPLISTPVKAAPTVETAADKGPNRPEPLDATSVALQPFQNWLAEYLVANEDRKAELEKSGAELARARAETMSRLIETDPRRALENAVPVATLKKLPASVAKNLEQHVEGNGRFQVLAAKGGAAKPITRFVNIKGNRYEAFVYGARDGQISTHDAVPMRGIALGNYMAVHENPVRVLEADEEFDAGVTLTNPSLRCPVSGKLIANNLADAAKKGVRVVAGARAYVLCSSRHAQDLSVRLLARSGEAAALVPAGNKSLIAYIVDFSDLPGSPLPDAQGHYNEVDRLYQDMSYGATRIQPIIITPVLRLPDTAGTYQALEKEGGFKGSNKLIADARAAAVAAGFNPSSFDLDEIYFGKLELGYGGLGLVGAKGSWNQGTGPVTSAHELGHNFGLGHGSSWVTTDGSAISAAGKRDEYGDVFEIMGGASDDGFLNTVNFNAWYKSLMGYVPGNRVQTVTASGTQRIFGLESIIGSGLHALKIRKDDDRDYWVEFRPRIAHRPNALNGAILHWGYKRIGQNSALLDSTPGSTGRFQDSGIAIGKTFSDPDAQVHITPIGKGGTTPESLDVVVNIGNFGTNRTPTVTVAASKSNPGFGEVITFTATASDPDGDTLGYYWDFGTGAGSSNSASISQSFAKASTAFTVTCTVTDMKGGTATASAVVTTGADFVAPNPTVTGISPATGSSTGRTSVLITGTNFLTNFVTAVTFGGVAATDIGVLNSTTLSCTAPAGTAGPVDVVVTHNNNPSTLPGAFTYIGAPTIASITPTSGGLRDDTVVTVTGTNFIAGLTSFRFGLNPASNVTVTSSTTATCIPPNATAAGTVDVSVAVGIPTAKLTGAYTYAAGPTLASLSVTSGAPAGGTTVVLTGSGFVAGTTVKFGANDATGVVVDSATQITCVTPAGNPGSVEVAVTVGGQVAKRPDAFMYVTAPTIASLTPNSGSTAGGARVTISGTGFAPGATVSVGGVAATSVSVNSASEIACDIPANATAAPFNVVVTLANGTASAGSPFTYVTPPAAPTLATIDINTGPTSGGTNVAITGTSFVVGATTVTFGTANATNVVVTGATTLTCTTPPGDAGSAVFTALVSGVASNTLAFTYTGPNAPTATASAPDPVAGEATMAESREAHSRALGADTGMIRIQLSALALVDTVITYTVTGAATPGSDFEALSGTATVLAGTNFVDIMIEPIDDSGDEGPEDVTITINSGAGFKVGATFAAKVMIMDGDTPIIDSIFPETGSAAGGDLVEISGENFDENNVVKIGGILATEVEVISPELISCRTPAGTIGLADVTVIQDTFTRTLTGAYLYIAPPTATKILPFSGPTSGGTPVTITGTNFIAGAEVEIGGSPCTSVVVVSSTKITCVTPSGVAGDQSVIVFVNDIPAVINQGFSYNAAAPLITSALTAAATKGSPFTYTITASLAPVTFEATNLPQGVTLSGAVISGTPTVAGVARIALKISGGTGSDSQTLVLTIAPGAGNTAPDLVSVTATPNPAKVGATVQFTAAAADAEGDLLDYSWNFGDGSPVVIGSNVTHIFATAGIFKISVTATDGAASDIQTLNLAVNATDSLAASASANRFTLRKVSVSFVFPQKLKDKLGFSGVIPAPDGFAPDGKSVTIATGDFTQTFALNAKRKFADATTQFKLAKAKNGVMGYKFSVKKSDLFASLKGLGFTDQAVEKPGISVVLPVTFSLDGSTYLSTPTLLYTSTGKKGSAK